jgi:hypothetical protein
MERDEAYYRKQAELTERDRELKEYYLAKADEVRKAAVRPEVENLTKIYVSKLRALGVDLPDGVVNVQVKAAS